jgi:hypothetical protein
VKEAGKMVEEMLSALAVVVVFAAIVSGLAWCFRRWDPHQFAMWKAELAMWCAALRRRPEGGETPAPESVDTEPAERDRQRPRLPRVRIERTRATAAPEAAEPVAATVGKSPSARLHYWVDR